VAILLEISTIMLPQVSLHPSQTHDASWLRVAWGCLPLACQKVELLLEAM